MEQTIITSISLIILYFSSIGLGSISKSFNSIANCNIDDNSSLFISCSLLGTIIQSLPLFIIAFLIIFKPKNNILKFLNYSIIILILTVIIIFSFFGSGIIQTKLFGNYLNLECSNDFNLLFNCSTYGILMIIPLLLILAIITMILKNELFVEIVEDNLDTIFINNQIINCEYKIIPVILEPVYKI
jgi:hypothetical protein